MNHKEDYYNKPPKNPKRIKGIIKKEQRKYLL